MIKTVFECPLCFASESTLIDQDKLRPYYLCSNCHAVFVPRDYLLTPDEEKRRYEAHQNDENDPGYINYLSTISDSMKPFLKKGDEGLDFGCGRTEVLGTLLTQAGYPTFSYDHFFRADDSYKKRQYSFIVLSEVIEHLRQPVQEMLALKELLATDGTFFIKTKFLPEDLSGFKDWFYKRDITHVQFFNQVSIELLAKKIGQKGKVRKIGADLYIMDWK